LVLGLLPGLERRPLDRQHINARSVVAWVDDADRLPPLLRNVHGREHQVDLALLQKLHAVRRHDRLQLKPDAKPPGDVPGEIGLETHDGTTGVAEAEWLVVGLGAHDQNAALLDLVERLRRQRTSHNDQRGDSRGSCNDARQHGLLPSGPVRLNEIRSVRSYSLVTGMSLPSDGGRMNTAVAPVNASVSA
jgi:hypothetical protein